MKTTTEKEYEEHTCPGCGDILKIPKAPATHTIERDDTDEIKISKIVSDIGQIKEQLSNTKKSFTDKIEDEPKINIEYPSFMPGEYCASGNCELGGVHPNKNYKRKAEKKCKNCDQFAPKNAPKCAWCGETEFAAMDDEDLENMGINLPHIEEAKEHEHTH